LKIGRTKYTLVHMHLTRANAKHKVRALSWLAQAKDNELPLFQVGLAEQRQAAHRVDE
jgi:hypothetical protein